MAGGISWPNSSPSVELAYLTQGRDFYGIKLKDREDLWLMTTSPPPNQPTEEDMSKQEAVEALTQAQQKLAENQAAQAKAQSELQQASASISEAQDAGLAQKLIADRAATQALLEEFLMPQAIKLQATVAEAQGAVRHLDQQARIEVVSDERVTNQIALAEAGKLLKEALEHTSELALEISQRYALLTAQMRELSSLQQAGCVAVATTEAMPTVQTVDELLQEQAKFGTLQWTPTANFKSKLAKAPAFKEEQK